MVEHPHRIQLEGFGRGELQARENRAIVRHLLTGCARCRKVTANSLPVSFLGAADAAGFASGRLGTALELESLDYSSAFAAVRRELGKRQLALETEREAAPALLRELAARPFDRQWMLVTSDPRFRTWVFCDLLLDASREWGFQDHARALELAELGAAVACLLSHEVDGAASVGDISARAWATLANAERIRSDFRAAERGFARAERLLKTGTGDPLEKAGVMLLKASLRGSQRRFAEAFRLLDRVVGIARRCGDLHLCGKALIAKGFLSGIAGQAEEAIRLLGEGIDFIDVESEPRLLVAARHNLILYLSESGRQPEALALLEQTRPLYSRLGDQMNLIRLRWVEGKIAAALGQWATAEALLNRVREDLVEQELGYDVALLS